ncbi:hypothetical protein MKW98_000334 [Papaver atlanticum]|uniref:Uncharacterized protein n=1 Tax=Papaver atlanticum TaxID=357466 RepID=A0AAD4S3R4_9MAGN|nr:hypothetical protein MKW98_000334 [Papaver atlanticum]
MGPLLTDIVKQAFVKLVGFERDGHDIKEITSQNIVFMGSVRDPGIPKLVDCQILGSNNGTGFRSLADLILHCKPSDLREELLSPSVRSFLRCLRNETGVDSWVGEKMKAGESDELLYHPAFLNHQEKYEYLKRMRDSLRGEGQYHAMKVPLEELSPVDFSGDWLNLLKGNSHKFVTNQMKKVSKERRYGYPNCVTVQGYVTCVRDLTEHINDKAARSDTKTPDYLGKLVEQISPGLFPAHFERHGGLQKKKKGGLRPGLSSS